MKIATLRQVGEPRLFASRWLGAALVAGLLLGAVNLMATSVTTLGGGPQYYNPGSYSGSSNSVFGTLYSQFNTPSGIAFDSFANYLYVADRDNNKVRYLDLTGGQTYTFAPYPPYIPTNLISRPVGVAVDALGNIFVLNRGKGTNGTVVEFDEFGDLLATNITRLTNANAIALDTSDNIFVTASNNVFKITSAGVSNLVATIPNAGASLQGIVFKRSGATAGLLAVCDSGRDGIYLIDPNTGLVTTNAGFNGVGDGTGINNRGVTNTQAKFFQPSGIAEAGDGSLIVADFGNHRVKVVSISGVTTNLYGVASNLWWGSYLGWSDGAVTEPDTFDDVQARMPFGVAIGSDGTIYTTEDYYHIIRHVTGADFLPPPPPPPSAPLNLTVTATNFNLISLSWSSSVGATNYHVKRSTSPGTEVTIATTSATSYTDTSVSNGTTYYYVVSALNTGGESPNSAEVSATTPIPPPPAPRIGWFDYEGTTPPFVSVLHPVSGAPFITPNDLNLAIDPNTAGVATYYTTDGSNPSATNGSTPPFYQDGVTFALTPLPVPCAPNLTIKAVNVNAGGSSAIVTAQFTYQVANPIILGNNAAQFAVSNITVGAQMYYTTDGSDPSPTNATATGPFSGGTLSLPISAGTNLTFKIRGFKTCYVPSSIVTVVFSSTNFVANTITFGQPSGEPHSSFIARPGQFFYAPVTLKLLPGFGSMYSLQFNVAVTNGMTNIFTGNPIQPVLNGAGIDFFSMLMTKVKPDEGRYFPPADGNWYIPLPPFLTYITNGGATNVLSSIFVNTNNNLLGIGWLYRSGIKYLPQADSNGVVFLDYDTSAQDTITYSIAHDTLFTKAGGLVVVGAYSFQVPSTATNGDRYFIQLGSPSATSDGVGAPGASIFIAPPAASQAVTVGSPSYLVGDAAPFHWLNAGDFGDTNLDNSDVMQVYQCAILQDADGQGIDMPPVNSDLFAAMDSAGNYGTNDGTGVYYQSTSYSPAFPFTANDPNAQSLFDGNDQTINTNIFGDGVLDVSDVYVTFRRSLDPSLLWFQRYWTNGQVVAVAVPNKAYNSNNPSSFVSSAGVSQSKVSSQTFTYQQSSVSFSAGDAIVSSGQQIQIPINAQVFGSYPLRVLGLNVTIHPLDGSPDLTQPVQFTATAALGSPTPGFTTIKGNDTYAAAWLDSTIAGISSNAPATIGYLTINIPTNATSQSAYAVHFDRVSGSPNGLVTMPKKTWTGLITLSSRTNSYYNDSIPDSWRLRWFGTIYNVLSESNACATGDGVNNWKKYIAGVDPTTPNDFPRVNTKPVPSGSTAAIHWPTVNGKKYVIMRSTSLYSGNWTVITTNTGTGGDMEFDDNNTGATKFYRVLILP